MIWVITGVVTSYVIAFVTCEHASLMGIKHPEKEGYYYGMFITCLTSFGFLIPVTIVILGIALYIMGK